MQNKENYAIVKCSFTHKKLETGNEKEAFMSQTADIQVIGRGWQK